MSDVSPVIGISGSSGDSASVRAIVTQIRSAGATPLFLANHGKRDAAQDLQKIDAVIFMGNNSDIDPREYIDRYENQNDSRRSSNSHTKSELDTPEGAARRDYEIDLMRRALDAKMPVLGICGGHQRLNILTGGTLHQHVPELIGHNEHAQQDAHIAPFIPVEPVELTEGSSLRALAGGITSIYTPGPGAVGRGIVFENSMHHQSVDRLGEGLRVAAYAVDEYQTYGGERKKLIEAVEADPKGKYKDQFVMGVQWHPEFGASPLGAKLATHLVGKAQEYAREHQREHPMLEAVEENKFSAMPVFRAGAQGRMIAERLER